MPIITVVAIYFIVWWLCLFLVLPFRVRNQVDAGEHVPGSERGAPAGIFRFWPKLLATTILAAVITGLLMWGLSSPFLQEYWR
jgi:predicted secreted protein